MNLAPGTLYFIGETDVLTGKTFHYYKIGLVKDSRQGDSLDRAGEHQTGNPRRLDVRAQVATAAISELENLMHDLYAPQRVFGEWFALSPAELKKAVTAAKNYATELQGHVKELKTAEEAKTRISSDKVIRATPKALAAFTEYQQAYAEAAAIERVFKLETEYYKALMEKRVDVSLYASVTKKTSPSFNKTGFAAAHPKLYKKFLIVREKPDGSFLPVKPKAGAVTIPRPLQKLLDAQTALLERLGTKPAVAELRELHLRHLELLAFEGRVSWREEFAKATLQTICKDVSGIEGVASWKRVLKESETFDLPGLRAAEPELAEEFTERKPVSSFKILDMRSYA